MKNKLILSMIGLGLSIFDFSNAFALSPIIRSFYSVRAAGMGDVRYTTGLFEENFYANPARAIWNPEDRFQLPQFSFETTSQTLSSVSALTKSNSGLSGFADSVGKPVSAHFQLVFPGYYKQNFITDDWTLAAGMIMGAQSIAEVSNSGVIDPTTVINAGPAITLARRFLEEDRLGVGLTAHAEFRATSGSSFSMLEFIKGTSISSILRGGSGVDFDFDLGTTFRPHWDLLDFRYEIGAAVNNILGGTAGSMGRIGGWSKDPITTPRTYNLGISATHKALPVFDSYTFALECTDIGNNDNGSFYRLLHFGTEERLKNMAFRLGLNQGYFTAGFGLDLGFFDLNLATYGEELGLNPGTVEDRRYALEFGFQI